MKLLVTTLPSAVVLLGLAVPPAFAVGGVATTRGTARARPVPPPAAGLRVSRRFFFTDLPLTLGAVALFGPELVQAKGSRPRSARLPGSRILVYENEPIIPGGHLTWGEATKGMSRWPTEESLVENAVALAKVYEQVRKKNGGAPLEIVSGYRPRHVNRRLPGTAKNSQHIYFRALDIAPFDGRYAHLLDAVRNTRAVHGIGVRKKQRDFVHMDIRPGKRVVFKY